MYLHVDEDAILLAEDAAFTPVIGLVVSPTVTDIAQPCDPTPRFRGNVLRRGGVGVALRSFLFFRSPRCQPTLSFVVRERLIAGAIGEVCFQFEFSVTNRLSGEQIDEATTMVGICSRKKGPPQIHG